MKRSAVKVIWSFSVCLAAFGTAFGQEIGFNGIGGRLSFVDPEDPLGATVGFGAHVDLGEIVPKLRLYPSLEYWNKSNVSQFAINGDVRYYFPTQGQVDLFAGGGLSIMFNHVDIGPFSNTDSAAGLDFLGGGDFKVAENFLGTVEVKFTVSDIHSFRITGGVTYLLGK
ncbi:porin family protein [bacterium]|nr:porin family protein [bacterium]